MNSVLLGGLKVFLINDGGFPLSAPGGRAKFFKAGTSTPETVYSDIDLISSMCDLLARGAIVSMASVLLVLPSLLLLLDGVIRHSTMGMKQKKTGNLQEER